MLKSCPSRKVTPIVKRPIARFRIIAVLVGAFPSLALVYPVIKRENPTIRTVAGMRYSLGKMVIESIGGKLPRKKEIKLEIAACQGLVNSSYSIPYFFLYQSLERII